MQFFPTPLSGAFTIEIKKIGDERGFFGRAFCMNEFAEQGIDNRIAQINNSYNADKGTLRGLHYQLPPMAETKIVRCVRGALFDVIVDLRKDSPTRGKWYGHELTAENRIAMVVPRGFAHGFITLEDHTEAFYLATQFYGPEQERGLRWNDPKVAIDWPMQPVIISEKDVAHADLTEDMYFSL